MGLLSTIGAASGRAFGLTRVGAAIRDAYFNLTTLLLPGNGTNGAQNNTFLDSSSNNFTITRNGNTTQGTFSPFSQTGWSNNFNGSGDWLSVASNAAFGFGTGDYTVEFWIYLSASPASGSKYTLLDFRTSSTAIPHTCYVANSSGTLYMGFFNGTSDVTSSSQPLTTNSWFHVAYARASGTLRIYVNGVQAYSAANTIDYQSSRPLNIGASVDTVTREPLNGYLSNLRILKGTAQYTAAFTPPTAPLTAITNTSLLTCQSNRFIDNSTNAFTITPTGTSVQAFSPFAPTAAYSAATVGGSGYFDGTGDYLTIPTNSVFQFGSGDFTVELWIYINAFDSSGTWFVGPWGNTGGTNRSWDFAYVTGGTGVVFGYSTNGTNSTLIQSSTTIQTKTWYHFAAVRNGNTLTIYQNGKSIATGSMTGITINAGTNDVYIGRNPEDVSQVFQTNGYVSNLRIVKGTAVYTSEFTPPTAPLTAITNTSLLCNFTNAGITDATAKNVLETVGGAQISTTQSKFGGSSMYFDGTGDYLIAPASPNNNLNIGDFTLEFWVYRANLTGDVDPVGCGNSSNTGYQVRIKGTTGFVQFLVVGGASITTTTGISATTWTHIAIVRSGTTVKIYINGTDAGGSGTVANSGTVTTELFVVGANRFDYSNALNGYIDDLRITRGYARYTANFTAPTAAFPLQ